MIGPNVLLVHCVNLKEDDIRRVGETGTHIAHCPAANASLGFGVAPVPEFLDAGVNVSLGSDDALASVSSKSLLIGAIAPGLTEVTSSYFRERRSRLNRDFFFRIIFELLKPSFLKFCKIQDFC